MKNIVNASSVGVFFEQNTKKKKEKKRKKHRHSPNLELGSDRSICVHLLYHGAVFLLGLMSLEFERRGQQTICHAVHSC